MKIISKKALGLFMCLFSLMSIYSQSGYTSMESVVGKENAEVLLKNKKISRFSMEATTDYCKIKPETAAAKDYAVKCVESKNYVPNYCLENVYVLDISNSASSEEEISRILKLVHQFSSMEGIQYYSHSRHKMDTLYHSCYTVDNPVNRNKIADNVSESFETEYVLFDDNSFGKYILEANFGKNNQEVYLEMINKDPLGFAGIKAIKPNDMRFFVDIIPCKDYLIVYINLSTRANVPGMFKGKIYDSLLARADAMYSWLKDSYEKGEK